ncbi:MAG TPA: hypothetical protein VKR59_07785 [Terriglobales bacterium]|nr:hypothetical protein [Terriglobales bacterium]
MKTFSKTQHSAENELVEFLADSAVVANLKKTLKSFASVPDGHIVHFYKYAGATKVRIVEPETKQ